jgi:GH24 family phage-related lysozyme (muramidase)
VTDLALLVADLQGDEGFKLINGRPALYDDATRKAVVPGYTLVGHPTGGYGFALDVSPLTQAESLPILTSRAAAIDAKLQADLPWVADLPEPIQRALADMAYNLGDHGEEQFTTFLGLVQAGQYGTAADDLMTTPWYKQVGTRGVRLVSVIRSGGAAP